MAKGSPRDALAVARGDALSYAQGTGVEHVRAVMQKAAKELTEKLAAMPATDAETFTHAQMRATLEQIETILKKIALPGIKDATLTAGRAAAEAGASTTIDYLGTAHKAFGGTLATPLPLKEASIFDRALSGVNSTILRRLASSGTPEAGADAQPSPAKAGILARYGMSTLGLFEDVLQQGLITRAPWADIRTKLTAQSPFLQSSPLFWAERIVRTETMHAFNRAGWEANREADEQLGDMCKILSATFDDRTGSDSYAVHGQIRRPDEAFESWFGLYQHPPNRPNDREIVVPHRISWPIPAYLAPKSDADIAARWAQEKRKGSPPPRPNMSTIDMSMFGKPQPLTDEQKAGGEEQSKELQGPLEQSRPLGAEFAAEDALAKQSVFDMAPRRPTLTPQEKAVKKMNAIWPEDPEDAGYIIHDFGTYSYSGTPPWLKNLSAAEANLVTEIIDNGTASYFQTKEVGVEDLLLQSKTTWKEGLTKTIGKVEDGSWKAGGQPIIVKKNGEHFVEFGTQDVLAHSLLDKTKIAADVLDLDDPEVQAKIAEKIKEAKNKEKAAKAAATKAANKAKKEAEEAAKKAAEEAAKKEAEAKAKAEEEAKKTAEEAAAKVIKPSTYSANLEPLNTDPAVILHKKTAGPAGSNAGGFYEGADGVKRYVKEYSDAGQAHGEAIANAIYRSLGFQAPESEVFEKDGKLHHAAKLFEGETFGKAGMTEDRAKKILDGFAADVLLANWDVVGMTKDNILVGPTGRMIRIDNGGSLLMRAKAGRKDPLLLHKLTEWENFFTSKNPSYMEVAQKAGVTEPHDFNEKAQKGIADILALREKHDGWSNFVSTVAPSFKGKDRDDIVKMLEARTKLLEEKLAELKKPKPIPKVQVAEPGMMAPPKTKFHLLDKAKPPMQTANGTPDGRPVSEYREHVGREIQKAPHESRSAITDFTGNSYTAMREAYSRGDTTSHLGRKAHAIPEAFKHAEPVPGTVYRCMGVSHDVGQAYCELPEDEPLHLGPWKGEAAFASSSRTMRRAIDGFSNNGPQPIMLVINNKRGIGIETISGIPGENEVLMHPNAHFRVTQRYRSPIDNRDFLVLHLDEMEQHEIDEYRAKKGKPPMPKIGESKPKNVPLMTGEAPPLKVPSAGDPPAHKSWGVKNILKQLHDGKSFDEIKKHGNTVEKAVAAGFLEPHGTGYKPTLAGLKLIKKA